MLTAAEHLADARCDAICWNGTSAGWLGIDRDRELCKAITERTGIPATSAVLAMLDVFRLSGVKRYGLVSPYADDVQRAIVATLGREGFECVGERHAAVTVNFDFAKIAPASVEAMMRDVAKARPDAIAVWCTNMDGATHVDALGRELCIPIVDSVAAALWGTLRTADPDGATSVHAHHVLRGVGAR
jgi:maleate isomerase